MQIIAALFTKFAAHLLHIKQFEVSAAPRFFTRQHLSRRWQAQEAVKKRKKIRKKIKNIVPVPIYVFVDSEQKAEFKAKIKPCSHQLNFMKFSL